MSYQVIARKWRPQTFEEVTGQEAITRTLRNAVEHERLHHAYLFSGARGVGKTTTARLLAKALNCHKTTEPNPTPCKPSDADACVSCREIAEGRSIDVLEFDAASNTQVDKIRDLIIENINISPARDRYKVFIIDEVHMLSTSSFNALLKTLEEPPPRVTFIMATTELHKVPDTILSRCQEFEFRTISTAKIFERLKLIAVSEKVNITDEGLRDIARSGEGSMRDAQSNFDQVISFSGEQIETDDVISALGLASAEMLTRTIKGIASSDAKEILAVVEDLIRRGQDLRNFCRDFLSFLRDLLIAKIAGDAEHLLESAALNQEELQNYGASFTEADLIRFFNSLSETETQLRLATQPRYILEIGLIKLIEMRRVTPIEKLLERLAKLEGALAGGNLQLNSNPAAENKPPVSSSLRDNSYSQAPPVEKKTPVIDFPVAEVPFPVGENVKTSFTASVEAPKSNFEPPESSFEPSSNSFEPTPSFDSLPPEEPPFSFAPPPIDDEPLPSSGFQVLDMDFINAIPVKLPTISSEELEHIEDTWLDNAYEEKLRRSGDTLFVIKSASLLVIQTLGDSSLNIPTASTASQQSGNGASAATAPARAPAKPFYIPQAFESEEEVIVEQIELSENPSDEELIHYAENHPDVRRVLKIFRGKVIKVTKDS